MCLAIRRWRAWERGGVKGAETLPLCKTNLENNLLPITRPSRRRDQEGELGQGEQRSKSVQNQRPPTRPGPRPESRAGSGRGLGRPAQPPPRSGPPPQTARDARHLHTLVHTHTRSATCSHHGWGLHRWHPEPGSAKVRASRCSGGVGSPPCGQAQETPNPHPLLPEPGSPNSARD